MQLFSSCGMLSHSFCSWPVNRGFIAWWELILWVMMDVRVCNTHLFCLLSFPPRGCQGRFYCPHTAFGGYNTKICSASASASRHSWCFWTMRSFFFNTCFNQLTAVQQLVFFSLTFLWTSCSSLQCPVKKINQYWLTWFFSSHTLPIDAFKCLLTWNRPVVSLVLIAMKSETKLVRNKSY